MRKILSVALLPLALFACSADSSTGGSTLTDEEYRQQAVQQVHDTLLADIQAMVAASIDFQNAAPSPPDRGWDPQLDANAITAMKNAWVRARTAYEHIEGALAPLFPNVDFSIDARYDDFVTQLEPKGGDAELFDDTGVTGMHAIERILYSDVTPQRVIDFESSLPGYVPAAFPANAQEAADFKSKLCGKFIADAKKLEALWIPANINVAIAFQGLISLVNEQREKVQKASSNEEESRYSQHTMADLRDNLIGTNTVYALFQPWITSKSDPSTPTKDGKSIDTKILKGLKELDGAYQAVSGASIPEPPATWSAENPSSSDLNTPFGLLYTSVQHAVDPTIDDSVVSQMSDAANVLGFPEFQGGQ